MFAVLGEIVFEVLTSPESFQLAAAYSYAEHKVVEAAPRLQWLANELARISLKLRFHVAFTSPKAQMDTLRAAGEDLRDGKPAPPRPSARIDRGASLEQIL